MHTPWTSPASFYAWTLSVLAACPLQSYRCEAMRVQLTEHTYPFLATGSDPARILRWTDAAMLHMLYDADWIEIAPRGLRFVSWARQQGPSLLLTREPMQMRHRPYDGGFFSVLGGVNGLIASARCLPSPNALCVIVPANDTLHADAANDNDYRAFFSWRFLPDDSAVANDDDGSNAAGAATQNRTALATTVSISSEAMQGLRALDPVIRVFAEAAPKACARNGEGRLYVAAPSLPTYVISACDIIEGGLVVWYVPSTNTIHVMKRTFGPIAYGVMLALAAACLYYAMTDATDEEDAVDPDEYGGGAPVALLTVACCLLVWVLHGIPFAFFHDALHFGVMCAACLFACLILRGRGRSVEACIYALSALADAMYRTPENAYAPLLCLLLGVRLWQKILTRAGDMPLAAGTLCLTVELGLIPQLQARDAWPFMAGAAALVTFAIARTTS